MMPPTAIDDQPTTRNAVSPLEPAPKAGAVAT